MPSVDTSTILKKSTAIEQVQGVGEVLLLKQKQTAEYLALEPSEFAILNHFDGTKTIQAVLLELFQSGKRPNLSRFYDLVLVAREKGFLYVEKEPETVRADKWPIKVPVIPAVFSAFFLIILGIAALYKFEMELGITHGFWFACAGAIAFGMSFSSLAAATLLKSWNREVYKFKVSFHRIIPFISLDCRDAFMAGRSCEASVALAGLTGPFVLALLYFPLSKIPHVDWGGGIILAAWITLFIATSPFGKSYGHMLIYAVFRKKHQMPQQGAKFLNSKFFLHVLRWKESLSEEAYFIAYSSYAILWLCGLFKFGAIFTALQYASVKSDLLLHENPPARFYLVVLVVLMGVLLLLIPLIFILVLIISSFWKFLVSSRISRENQWRKAKEKGRPSEDRISSFLDETTLFHGFDKQKLETVAHSLKFLTVPAGQLVIREGDAGDLLFIIWSGEVTVLKEQESGEQLPVAGLFTADVFGEVALLEKTKRTSSVKTSRDTELLLVTKDDFEKLIVPVLGEETIKQRIQTSGFLRRTDLFRDWHPHALSAVAQSCKLHKVLGGEKVIQQDQANEFFYIVYEGRVEVRKDEQFVSVLETGDFFGEVSLLKGGTATADVVALGATSFFKIGREDFFKFITKDFLTGYLIDQKLLQRTEVSL